MKKLKKLVSLCMILLLLCGCGFGGRVSGVERTIGSSECYSAAEIKRAMKVVERHFRRHFHRCTLTELEYDEANTKDAATEWAEQYAADGAIVLTSSFEVGSRSDGSLEPNSTYRNWQWVLTRTDTNSWELQTWGYG